jgi:hypothetical protein
MARTSFRIRRDTSAGGDIIGVGSFARGAPYWQGVAGVPTNLQDTDKALRSTNFVVAFETDQESTFEATAVDYDTVQITWSLSEVPVNESEVTTSGLIGVVVRYSPFGFPESAADGEPVFSAINADDDDDLGNKSIFHTGVPEGRWAYYSLFGRYYQVGGGYWYEKFASVETIVPDNYDSTMQLWKRIPQYYRERDNGDLYKFLDVFGFEADRTKTLMRTVFMSFNPSLTEVEGVDQLAKLLGLEIGVQDIGVSRTRALLQDIGFLRQRKGTLNGIIGTLQALSGADAEFDYNFLDSEWIATIYAQRANLIGNPKLGGTTSWAVDNVTSTVTADNTSGRLVITNTGSVTTKVALISKISVPVEAGITYYMSANFGDTPTVGISIQPVNEPVFYGVGFTPAGTTSIDYGTTVVEPVGYVGTRPVLSRIATESISDVWPTLSFELEPEQSITVSEWMLEPYKYGEYFDGSSDFGGFLYGNNFNDYKWTGSANASYSTLVVQRKRTEEAIKKIFNSILPVNLPFDPNTQIQFDWIPGKS